MKSILNYINQYRKSETNNQFLRSIYIIFSTIIIIFILICFIESIFYLTSYNRKNYIILLLSIFTTSIFFIMMRWTINYYKLFLNNTDEKIAQKLGEVVPEIKDQLLNVIQLNSMSPNLDLTKLAIQKIEEFESSGKVNLDGATIENLEDYNLVTLYNPEFLNAEDNRTLLPLEAAIDIAIQPLPVPISKTFNGLFLVGEFSVRIKSTSSSVSGLGIKTD